ncbi:MAG: HD domain-containing phosphohydrolase, partial [Desulfopila sp.]
YEMYCNHPKVGAELLEKIPRLEEVAVIIKNQLRPFAEFQEEGSEDDELSMAAQIIKAAFDYDRLISSGATHGEACRRLKMRRDVYNPEVVKTLATLSSTGTTSEIKKIKIHDLTVGMIAEESIIAKNETLLVPKGQEITGPLLQGIRNFNRRVGVKGPILVRVASRAAADGPEDV